MKKVLQNKKFQAVILLVLTTIVLFFLLKDDFGTTMSELIKMDGFWIIITMFLVLSFWFFKALGINIITRQKYTAFRLRDSIQINMTAQFFNSITPYSVGGHPAQVYLLTKKRVSITDGTNIIIQNFIVYQIAVSIIQFFAVFMVFSSNLFTENYLFKLLMIIGLVADVAIIAVLFLAAFSTKLKYAAVKFGIFILGKLKIIKDKQKTLAEWNEKLNNFNKSAHHLIKNKWQFIKAILCNFAGLLLFYLTPLTLMYATGDYNSIDAVQSIYLLSCAVMVSDLIPTPGKIGGAEYAFSILFIKYIEPAKLAAILIAWRFLSYYLTLIIGGIILNLKRDDDEKQTA